MNSEQILLSYSGEINYDTHEMLVEKIKILSDLEYIDQVVRKRLIYIIIEGLENIYKHSNYAFALKNGGIRNDDVFTLGTKNDGFTIKIGNQVNALKAGLLKVKIEYINTLNHEALKDYYNEVITNGLISESNGAGLGLIRIALKSGIPIRYTLEKLENDLYFFNMWVELPKILKHA